MARKFYEIVLGMHEHPETYEERGIKVPASLKGQKELLYPGDVALVEEALALRPPTMGGWADPQKDGTWKIVCARELAGWQQGETRVLRDEPSRISGINVSAAQLQRIEREEAEGESMAIPVPSVARQSPSSVKKVRTA